MEENVFSVPLDVKKVERRNRTARAVREVKKFARKRADKKVKLDQELNDILWEKGAQKPPSSIKVRLVDSGEYVTVQPPKKKLPSEEEFECEECGKTFSTEQGLGVHVSRAHEEEEEEEEEEETKEEKEKYVCEVCDREFDTKRGLSIHESQAHKGIDEQETERYEEVLSGTITEAREVIDDMENPDFEALLEIEEENKDRKGMKKFLRESLD
ncbi:MAG: C2H2-type zinc finger protein [Candidatus Aenigmatarchaeota archaeon]